MHAFDIEEVSRTGAAFDVTSSLVPVPPCGSFVPATLPWSPFCREIGARAKKMFSSPTPINDHPEIVPTVKFV